MNKRLLPIAFCLTLYSSTGLAVDDALTPTTSRILPSPSASFTSQWKNSDNQPQTSRFVTQNARYSLRDKTTNGQMLKELELNFIEADPKAETFDFGIRLIVHGLKGNGRYQVSHHPETFIRPVNKDKPYLVKGVSIQENYNMGRHIPLIRHHFASVLLTDQQHWSTGETLLSEKKHPDVGGWIEITAIDSQQRIQGNAQLTMIRERCTGPAQLSNCTQSLLTLAGKFVARPHNLPGEKRIKPKGRLEGIPSGKMMMANLPQPPLSNPRHAECPAPTGSACEKANQQYQRYTDCFKPYQKRCEQAYQRYKAAANTCNIRFKKHGC